LTLYNENYSMPALPRHSTEGILAGMYRLNSGTAQGGTNRTSTDKTAGIKVQLLGSGPILRQILLAQQLLAEKFGIVSDLWSVTSYKEMRRECLSVDRWNRLHPAENPRQAYLTQLLQAEEGPFIAACDYMKSVPELIAPWVPGGLTTLGTDGFGRSDSRAALRRFFEVDAESIVIASLDALAKRGRLKRELVTKAIRD